MSDLGQCDAWTDSKPICPDCVQATLTVWGGFRADCQGCKARAVARGANFAASRKEGTLTRRYRQELEQFGVTHGEVRAAAAGDQQEPTPCE